MDFFHSNTTLVKVKSIKSHVRGFKNRIQIQHLLKLNVLVCLNVGLALKKIQIQHLLKLNYVIINT